MLMWNRVRRFSALPPEARRLFLRAAVMLPMVALSLKLRGFRATQEWLQKRTFPTRADRGPSTVGQRCDTHVADAIVAWNVRMVNAACRYVCPGSTCLEKSLTLWQLLSSQGIDSTIRIGARKLTSEFEAHAWVERNGVPLNELDSPHQHYSAFAAEFPSATTETP